MAWLSGYTTRKKLTTDHTKIDSDLTNFPMVMILNSNRHDFAKGNSDGFDTRITKSDGETLEKYERERHDSGNSKAEYWWKGSTVSSASDNDWYFYYRTQDTADGADPTNVWDSDFKGVWHLKDLTTSTIKDSISGGHDGTKKAANEPIEIDGKIAKAQDFDGTNDYISTAAFTNPTTITFEVWIKPDFSSSETIQHPIIDWADDVNNRLYLRWESNTLGFYTDWYDNKGDGNTRFLPTFSAGDWHYLVVDIAADSTHYYWDGNYQTPTEHIITALAGSSDPINLGKSYIHATRWWDGILDEIKISNVVRSAAWIKASYNSGNDSLLTYGSEETATVEKSVSDSGSGVEIVGIKGAIPIAESGLGVDIIAAITGKIPVADSGIGTDAVSKAIIYLKSVADSGIGADAVAVKLVKAVQDSGVGVDVISAILAKILLAETGTGVDAVGILSKTLIQDSGVGADLASTIGIVNISESGIGSDIIKAILAKLLLQESGVGAEQLAISKCVDLVDSGTGLDLISILAKVLIQEIGVGVDQVKVPPIYTDKFTPQGDSYTDKYSKQGDIYHNKFL